MVVSILLTTPEPQNTITHYKICSWNFEVPRADIGKAGFVNVWIAKCYQFNGTLYEPDLPGINIVIDGDGFDELITIVTTTKGLMDDSMEILGQFLINKGYIAGTILTE